MVFSSISFLIFFLPCLFLCYFIIPKKFRNVRNFVLLLFSLFFYGFGGPKFLLLMIISILINYVCGILASNHFNKTIRKIGSILAVILGMGLLVYFKYTGFFVEILNSFGAMLPVPEITLPIGISFFTFQGLSYVLDVYSDDAEVQKNPLKLALYISLFPQLVAGPIVRYTTVADEITKRDENIKEFADGIQRFCFGLAKKMIIANAMGEIADKIFSLPSPKLSITLSWIGAIAYTIQIYFDFSSYSDMAIGLGKMFGFHFLENFDYPYVSKSITEFWRRWHISLSTWFRDYVYIPLGGNRCTKLKQIRNMFVVWLLTGLWHGSSWNFVVWGLWFFILLLGEKYVWGRFLEKCPNFLRHIYTMLLVIISWVFFRAENLSSAMNYLSFMFGLQGNFMGDRTIYYLFQYAFEFFVGIAVCFPLTKKAKTLFEKHSDIKIIAVISDYGPKFFAICFLMICYMKLATGSFNPFIYFRF